MTKKELKNRWDGFISAEQLNANDSPFGRTENDLIDWRGVSFDIDTRCFHSKNVDLSYSALNPGQFYDVVIDNGLFEEVNYTGTIFGTYLRCRFIKSKLELDFITAKIDSCVFQDSHFKKSTFTKKVFFTDCHFENCDLSKSQFIGTHFDKCTFIRCKTTSFTSFAQCQFQGCDLNDMDFGDALVEDMQII